MSAWFYQISPKSWDPQRYRVEIWEDERWSWPVGRISSSKERPKPGDVVAFYYAPSGGDDPGFYGWAVVSEWFDENNTLYFRPVAPSNHLKMHPWWDEQARQIADEVRGKFKQGTLWKVPSDLWERVQRGITAWVGGQSGSRPISR